MINIPHDKALHFGVGAVIAAAGMLISPAIALLWCFLIGAGKEFYDKTSGTGDPSWGDFFATMAGGLTVLFPYLFWMFR